MSASTRFPEFSLLELVEIISRRWRLFILLAVLAALLSFAGSFLITPRYEAISSLLPRRSDMVGGYSSVLERGMIRGGLRIRNTTVRNSINMERLLSSELRYTMVDSLGLVDFFGLEKIARKNPTLARERAARRLLDVTHYELSIKIRVLRIHVTTHDPEMSARIANVYLDILDQYNREGIQREAAGRVRYLDERLQEARAAVSLARGRLKDFQQQRGISNYNLQTSETFELIGNLRQRHLDLELERETLLKDAGPDHVEVQLVEAELEIYRRVLERMASADGAERDEAAAGDFLQFFDLPLSQATSLSHRLGQLNWELEILQALEINLIEERERNRLEQFLDVETTAVLDRATVPSEPVWPQRKLFVLLVVVVTVLVVYLSFLFKAAVTKAVGGWDRQSWRRFLAES